MDDIKKTFKRNVNKEKISKIDRNKFLKAFVKGSDYEEDFSELEESCPDLIDYFTVNDKWVDKKGILREVKDDYYIICEKRNESFYIIGEMKFDKYSHKPVFGRFSECGLFSMLDNFIVDKKEVIKGIVPYSEWLYPLEEKEPKSFYNYTYTKEGKSKLEIEYSIYSKKLKIEFVDFKGKRAKIFIDYNKTPFKVSYIVDEYKLVVKALEYSTPPTKKLLAEGDLHEDKSPFDENLNEIKDTYYEIINGDFKKETLADYIKIYKNCEEIVAKY